MAQRSEAFRSGRFYLPTSELTDTSTKFGNITPAFNNNYDVSIDFSGTQDLRGFINQHGFYDQNGGRESLYNAGSYLALFCSEAVLPGSDIQVGQVDGLRQGLSQHYATFRRFPDILLTYYSQTDYYTNDVFNAWMEFISPTRIKSGESNTTFGTSSEQRKQIPAFRRIKYPETYKCNMEITAFSKDVNDEFSKLNKTSRFNNQLPSSITYHVRNVFPSSIVAAPLAYGRAELIKTTITFKYEQYFIDRTSRKGPILSESDRSRVRGLNVNMEEARRISEETGKSITDAQIIASGGFTETLIQ